MFKVSRILVIVQVLGICAVALSACGQKGPLVHPQDPMAADRATLLETLTPKPLAPAQRAPGPENTPTSPTPPSPPAKKP